MNRIEVHSISFTGRHGCYPEERIHGRKFEVDVTLWFDLLTPATSDRIADTFSYDDICATVYRLGTQESFHLIERLAHEIAQQLLQAGPAQKICVVVRKFVPELPGSPAFVSAIIEAERSA